MKQLRAEIGRIFGRRYVVTQDFEGTQRLHRRRKNVFVGNDWCFVYDLTKVGSFTIGNDGTCRKLDGELHYIKKWKDYEEVRVEG